MSAILERRAAVTVGGTAVGDGPAAVVGGRVSLRDQHGRGDAAGVPTGALVEPFSAADLPALAGRAAGFVVGAAWMQDFRLVRAVARLGLPVVVQRGHSATLEEWLGVADYCVVEGNDQVILSEPGFDLGLVQAAKERSGRPVLVDVSGNFALCGAAVAAGADGLLLPPGATAEHEHQAREAVTLVGALLRPEAPATLADCRGAIDRVDAALAVLLEQRAALAGIVQTLKPVGGFAGRDMERERRLVAVMAQRAPELGETGLAPIMNAVIEAGLRLSEERRGQVAGGRG